MRPTRVVIVGLLFLAALQAVAAFELLSWSMPLFGDPPILGNGARDAARQLGELARQYPDGFKRISTIDRTFLWLFHRQLEAVLFALGAGIALALSAFASLLFAALLFRGSRARLGQGT